MVAIVEFLPASPPQPLADDEIHLWFLPQWRALRDATATPAVRQLLASYLQCAPERIQIVRDAHGKPRLRDVSLEFNLSHSGGALLLALSRDAPLGVDLEAPSRARPFAELAQRWFAPSEAAVLAALPPSQQQTAFLRLWTCKEALVKALGRGLSYGLQRVEFELSPTGDVLSLRAPAHAGIDWQVELLTPAAPYVGAVAAPCGTRTLRAFVTQAIAGAAQSG